MRALHSRAHTYTIIIYSTYIDLIRTNTIAKLVNYRKREKLSATCAVPHAEFDSLFITTLNSISRVQWDQDNIRYWWVCLWLILNCRWTSRTLQHTMEWHLLSRRKGAWICSLSGERYKELSGPMTENSFWIQMSCDVKKFHSLSFHPSDWLMIDFWGTR